MPDEKEYPKVLYVRVSCAKVPLVFGKQKLDLEPRPNESRLTSVYRSNGFSHLLAEERVMGRETDKAWLTCSVTFPDDPADVRVAGRLEPVGGRSGYWMFGGSIPAEWIRAVEVEWRAVFKPVSKRDALAYASRERARREADRKARKARQAKANA